MEEQRNAYRRQHHGRQSVVQDSVSRSGAWGKQITVITQSDPTSQLPRAIASTENKEDDALN